MKHATTGQVTAEAFVSEDGADAAYFTSVFEYAVMFTTTSSSTEAGDS